MPSHCATANSPVVGSSQAAPSWPSASSTARTQEVLGCLEGCGIELRPRRHDADHLASHDSLGGLRVLHLLAQRYTVPEPDEARDVARGCVVWHSAHWNWCAVLVL